VWGLCLLLSLGLEVIKKEDDCQAFFILSEREVPCCDGIVTYLNTGLVTKNTRKKAARIYMIRETSFPLPLSNLIRT